MEQSPRLLLLALWSLQPTIAVKRSVLGIARISRPSWAERDSWDMGQPCGPFKERLFPCVISESLCDDAPIDGV
jgi:hypothetical protein